MALRALALGAAAVFLAAGSAWLLSLRGHLLSHGGTRGDYGEAYRFQLHAARLLAEISGPGTRLQFDTRLRDGGAGIEYLASHQQAATASGRAAPARQAIVHSLLARPFIPPPDLPRGQDIGPYAVRWIPGK